MNKKAIFLMGVAQGSGKIYLLKALGIAHELHDGVMRKDGVTDYVDHVVAVALLLYTMGIRDDDILAAAILHDTVEDTGYTYEDVEREFNKNIADLVELVTKKDGVSDKVYFANIETDIRAVLIKACDRTHNVGDMVTAFSADKMNSYNEETEEYVLPAMKRARKTSLEYGNILVALTENIKALLILAKEVVRQRAIIVNMQNQPASEAVS